MGDWRDRRMGGGRVRNSGRWERDKRQKWVVGEIEIQWEVRE